MKALSIQFRRVQMLDILKKIIALFLVVSVILLCACGVHVKDDVPSTANGGSSDTTEENNPTDDSELPTDMDETAQTSTEEDIDVVIDTTEPDTENETKPSTTVPTQPGDGNKPSKPNEDSTKPSTEPEEEPTTINSSQSGSGGIELPFIPG